MLNYLIEFLGFSNVHGLHFIVNRRIFVFERILWIALVLFSWVAAILLILAAWDDFQHNSLSFMSENNYLDWKLDLPAIILCEEKDPDYLESISEKYFGTPNFYLPDILEEIVFFQYETENLNNRCKLNGSEQICLADYRNLTELVRRKCYEAIFDCVLNGESFNCCEYFLTVETELGKCFALNSLHTRYRSNEQLNTLTSFYDISLPVLTFKIAIDLNMAIMSHEELPNLNTQMYALTRNTEKEFDINVEKILNDPDVKSHDPKLRNCLFPDEKSLSVQKFYSYNGCVVDKRKKKMQEICNCTEHLIPNITGKVCDREGLLCLSSKSSQLLTIQPLSSPENHLVINCVIVCDNTEITMVSQVSHAHKDESDQDLGFGEVELRIFSPPVAVFKRVVVRNILDMIVSVGGAAGLFLGASVLSFIELFYYLVMRIWTKDRTTKEENLELDNKYYIPFNIEFGD